MSYRLEDLYHFATEEGVDEEQARLAARQSVDNYIQLWMKDHPDYTLRGIFTAGLCCGQNIKKSIKQRIKNNGKVTV
jgi:hypothetical protein